MIQGVGYETFLHLIAKQRAFQRFQRQLYNSLSRGARHLTGLVETESDNVRVDHAQVERSDVEVQVSERNEHGVVDKGITLVDGGVGLVCVTTVRMLALEYDLSSTKELAYVLLPVKVSAL